VKSINLVTAWDDATQFLTDEARWDRLVEESLRTYPGRDHPLVAAVNSVLEATGESLVLGPKGEVSIAPAELDRLRGRIGAVTIESRLSFVDRHGREHLPFATAVELAKAFAAAQSEIVLAHIDVESRRARTEVREPGNAHLLALTERWHAGWALCRQWAGIDRAVAERETEVERLRRILLDTEYELHSAGHDELANRLHRKLAGR
jgi:hypothetical protein